MHSAVQRFEVTHYFLDVIIRYIAQYVQGCPIELVFNFDEVDIFEWEDRTTKSVIVLVSTRKQMIHQKINQSLMNLFIIACISAAGENLTLYIVISQDSSAIRVQLKKRNLHFYTNLILKNRSKPYINAQLFTDNIHIVFLSNRTIEIMQFQTIKFYDINDVT
jgi:hypothetical protein